MAKKSARKSAPKASASAKKKSPSKPVSKAAAKSAAASIRPAKAKSKLQAKSTPPAAKASPSKKAGDWSKFFSPLDDRVLAVREIPSDRTPGGLYIPDTASEAGGPARAIVIAAGRGRRDKKGRLHPLDVQVNDHILFDSYSGTDIEMQGEKVVVLRENDVLGVVKP